MRAVKNFKADMARQFIQNWIKNGRFTRGDQMPTEPARDGIIARLEQVRNFISTATDLRLVIDLRELLSR